jgi:MoxR-like ATPase
VSELIQAVRRVHLSPEVRRYAVELTAATRRLGEVRLGASPRATLHLVRASRAQAALAGRDYVVPDDVQAVAVPVLAHRLVLTAEGQAARRPAADLIRSLLQRIAVPQGGPGQLGAPGTGPQGNGVAPPTAPAWQQTPSQT